MNKFPLNGPLTLIFQLQMYKGLIYWPVKLFSKLLILAKLFLAKFVSKLCPDLTWCRCIILTDEAQHALPDGNYGSERERKVWYPIPRLLWKFDFFITYNLHRTAMAVWVLSHFATLFQRQREPIQVLCKFLCIINFVFNTGKGRRKKGRTVGTIPK